MSTEQRPEAEAVYPAATPFRLAEGGLIDRGRSLTFTFDGKHYPGHRGDTLASALVANGVRLVGRSFKYHRPRGLLSAGPEEPNGLVELRAGARREPNTRATTIELWDGLTASSQNRWPSLRHDVMAINGMAGPMIAAGFYYKTFMWPASFWEKLYEPLIRRAAGLGRAAGSPDPDTYEKAHLHCDVLVVGSGPAGLMAALAAGRAGARVVLAEEDFRLGGRLLAETFEIAGRHGSEWAQEMAAELAALPHVRILARTSVAAAYDHGAFMAVERVADHLAEPPSHGPRQRLWRIAAKQCVLAAGAIERPLVFANNDRPGVMLAGAVRAYLNRYAAVAGRRAVVAACHDDAARTVADLAHAGVDVVAVVDTRREASPAMRAAASGASARFFEGAVVTRAQGRLGVEAVDIRSATGEAVRVYCDLVAMSGGWAPSLHLACHQGRRPHWSDGVQAFVAGDLPPGMSIAGASNAAFGLVDALAQGEAAGRAAADACGFSADALPFPACPPDVPSAFAAPPLPDARGKAFVDFQNDVTASDIAQAHSEGYRAPEHMKRYTTLGMATDQGKTANVNALAILSSLGSAGIGATGTTTFRPPVSPVSIGVLAGHHRGRQFRPTRLTPTHAWALEQGAEMIESGAWLRAQWYPRAGERDWLESVTREVQAVRSGAGVCDVSTLGKIDVQGADADQFLDFVYANTISTLALGRVRYGLMLREDGFVMDDGTVARIGPERFAVTTTTANAARVLAHMEHAAQWLRPSMDVHLTSTSDQWAQLALAGPNARDVLTALVDDARDVSRQALPHMRVREARVLGGVAARIFAISYSGEQGFEIAVPAAFGDALIRRVMVVGAAHGITPYGTEAMSVMRIEKGHAAGNEINGQTTARDLGLSRLVSKKKDCIGRVMAERPALVADDRQVLVGIKAIDAADRLRAGAHMLAEGAEARPENDLGHVTSVAFSPTLGRWIGLALVAGGEARYGQRLRAWDAVRDGDAVVEVCAPVFVDPEGVRLNG